MSIMKLELIDLDDYGCANPLDLKTRLIVPSRLIDQAYRNHGLLCRYSRPCRNPKYTDEQYSLPFLLRRLNIIDRRNQLPCPLKCLLFQEWVDTLYLDKCIYSPTTSEFCFFFCILKLLRKPSCLGRACQPYKLIYFLSSEPWFLEIVAYMKKKRIHVRIWHGPGCWNNSG